MSEKNSIEKENESKVYICENCGKEHDGSYGSGRFCSKSAVRFVGMWTNQGSCKTLSY